LIRSFPKDDFNQYRYGKSCYAVLLLLNMSEAKDLSPKPSVKEDLLSLRTAVEKVRAFRIMNDQPVGREHQAIKDTYKQGDKLARSEGLVTNEQQGEFIDQIGKVRDLVFEHGSDEIYEDDEDPETHYKKLSFGMFSVYADQPESVDQTYLSFTADDKANKASVDLTVNEDMKSFEFETDFLNANGRRDVKYASGEQPMEKMTETEFRILMHYMKQYIKELPIPNTDAQNTE
jgi:hypothetical protein